MSKISTLDDFQGWDTESSGDDFFSKIEEQDTEKEDKETPETAPENLLVSDEELKREETTEEEVEDKAPVVEEEESLFPEENTVVNNNKAEGTEESEEVQETEDFELAKALREKGLLDFEDEELEEEDFTLEDKFEEAVETKLSSLFEDLPDTVKQLNKFALEGGDVNDFLKTLSQAQTGIITEDLDLDLEANQELVMKEVLKAEGNDAEEIQTQIDYLKEVGKLEKLATKKFDRWKNANAKQKEQILEEQKAKAAELKQIEKQNRQKVIEYLRENTSAGALQFNKQDKKDLPAFINDKSVKLQNGASITPLQRELFYNIPQNRKAMMQLATLVKNRNEDGSFNFDSILKTAQTEVTKKVKANVRRAKTITPTASKSDAVMGKKSLADYFN